VSNRFVDNALMTERRAQLIAKAKDASKQAVNAKNPELRAFWLKMVMYYDALARQSV
jgi:hypothetical protein